MRKHLWAVTGVVLLGVCAWLVLPLTSHDDFGWTAYTPQSDWCSDSAGACTGILHTDDDAVVLSQRQVIGFLTGVLGLTVIATGIGLRLGQRRGRDTAGV